MCNYGFVAGQDFSPISGKTSAAGGRPRTDHIISLDMAKEISMIQRTEKGKQARQYFIECEKRYREAETHKAPAELSRLELLQLATQAEEERLALEEKNKQLEAEAKEAEPKVAYHDYFVAGEDLIQFRTVANQLNIGEQKLREILQDKGWIYRLEHQRWSNKQGKLVVEYQWRAKAGKKQYFRLVAHHDAPRLGGEVRQTLKITPAGATAIARALKRWGHQTELVVA